MLHKLYVDYYEEIDLANTVEELEDIKERIEDQLFCEEEARKKTNGIINYRNSIMSNIAKYEGYLKNIQAKRRLLNDPTWKEEYTALVESYIRNYEDKIEYREIELEDLKKCLKLWRDKQ